MGVQSTVPYMDSDYLSYNPSILGTYLGPITELAFEASPGCAPDPAPPISDYYQLTATDGDAIICGHAVTVGDFLVWSGAVTGWVPQTPADSPSSFLALTDTPSSYTGTAANSPIVADTEDALVFDARAAGADTFTDYADMRAHTGYKVDERVLVYSETQAFPTTEYIYQLGTDADQGNGGVYIRPDDYTDTVLYRIR